MADTISDKLVRLNEVKQQIKQSIIDKGVAVADTDPFSGYAAKIGEISGGGAPATKFGCTVDNFLGNVDADGVYTKPTEPVSVNFSGVKIISNEACTDVFRSSLGVDSFIANDVINVGVSGFKYAFYSSSLKSVHIDNLEIVDKESAFEYAFYGASYLKTVSFKKLREVNSNSAFYGALNNSGFYNDERYYFFVDEVFPSLEIVAGDRALSEIFAWQAGKRYMYSKIKKITGSTGQYGSTFGYFYIQNTKWYFPSATEFTGYIWNVGATYSSEIHFAVANQAAIEACDGYTNKWGNAGATIYFDLILSIAVNGVVYSREYMIGGYTSWKDADGNIVYTDSTAEPAVDTVVYSDQGTTQVGTVSEVA